MNRFQRQKNEFEEFDRRTVSTFRLFWILWCVGSLLSLGFAGVLIWAVIRLVTHFTGH